MFAASSSSYGDSIVAAQDRDHAGAAHARPYAANKVARARHDEEAYAPSHNLDTVALRYFNIYGPRQNANSAYAAVIANFAKDLIAGKRPTIYGDGLQSRDFTFVANAVYANLLAARSAQPLEGEVINVAVGQRITVNELAEIMAPMMGRPELQADLRAGTRGRREAFGGGHQRCQKNVGIPAHRRFPHGVGADRGVVSLSSSRAGMRLPDHSKLSLHSLP